MRLALIGDIHGCLGRFRSELARLGVDLDRAWIPQALQIIQVGDLVHGSGENQTECVLLADRLLRANPDRYFQLWGNHDAHYIGGPDVSDRRVFRQLAPTPAAVLRRWHATGSAQLAAAIRTDELGDVLVTHGGLTQGLWRELGSPEDAAEAARRINALLDDPGRAFRPGWLMTGEHDMAAGVLGPRTGAELAASWLAHGSMPFHQIHGHESVWWWPDQVWHDDAPQEVIAITHVDTELRRSATTIAGKMLWSIDGKLDDLPAGHPWRCVELTGFVQ